MKMKHALRYLSALCILILASLLPLENALAGRGGGGRGGGARGGGASPRVNSSVNMQNRGNFSGSQQNFNRPQPSIDRSQTQQNWQTDRTNIQDNRQQQINENQGNRQTNQQNRQQQIDENQGNRQTNQQNRQEQINENQGNRQEEARNRQENRQDYIDDNYDNRWYGGGWYGGGYYVPPGWGWAGFATGLVIGSAVSSLPPYYNTVYVGSNPYIYSDGVFLQSSGSSYIVVAPPVNAVVTYLPDGCKAVQQNNVTYYNCSGIYYQPVFQNGSTVYKVVQF